ncbi:MAG: NAD(P)/FAD-dependent oxidoreductase [Spirochaetaceae bacterium]|jgi:thioredoxin reductase|nr:NAD(P)/FAD-dependent oxidoreductase [Spirochaetaceae bacterium]
MVNGEYDVTVIGGGPGGLAAAISAERAGARVLLVEREGRLGGILKQCIHDGFGLLRFGEKLSGPEYAHRFVRDLPETVDVRLLTFVTRCEARKGDGFAVTLTSAEGIGTVFTRTLVLATGCRERTARQIGIHGTRPAGVLTAGSAQYYTNILGKLPGRRVVVLGSGDIGLIMARRLTLEGAQVLGVYEAKGAPSGLSRNIAQCLEDFGIPLHLGATVTRVFGQDRLEAVEVMRVDGNLEPLEGTAEVIPCDGLILSVGLIPENELAESLGVPLSPVTGGPLCDQRGSTLISGIYSCGNAFQVNDLVDYVSESGETAGREAARFASRSFGGTLRQAGEYAALRTGEGILTAAPQFIEPEDPQGEVAVFFRVRDEGGPSRVRFTLNRRSRLGHATELLTRDYRRLRPPEMERVTLKFPCPLEGGDEINVTLEAAP